MSTPSSSPNPTSKHKRFKMILARHPYQRLRRTSELPPASCSKSIEVSPSACSRPDSQRKPRVIISNSESEEDVASEPSSLDEGNVVLADVLKWKATTFASATHVKSPTTDKKFKPFNQKTQKNSCSCSPWRRYLLCTPCY
uniref:Uncharacterized protein n=1 Tax=Cucumis melo TaxID=3656 RepID=A0A9I9DN77_CUCME